MASGSMLVLAAANQAPLAPSQPQALNGTAAPASFAVQVAVSGQQWASVRVDFDAVFVGVVQPQYSKDGGKNWINAPYGTRLDQVSANPTVAATFSPNADSQSWEVPLPGNATNFRAQATTSSTPSATACSVSGSKTYTPGVPVVATLYDVTSGINAALDTGILDMSGWSNLMHDTWFSGGVAAFTIQEVDDAGANTMGNIVSAAAGFFGGLGGMAPNGSNGTAVSNTPIPLPKRIRYQSGAISAQSTRIRLVARR